MARKTLEQQVIRLIEQWSLDRVESVLKMYKLIHPSYATKTPRTHKTKAKVATATTGGDANAIA